MGTNLSRISGYLTFLSVLLAINTPLASRPVYTCPIEIETLTDHLLPDLPSYANRVIQRSRRVVDRELYIPLYVIIAGRPEFDPLPLKITPSQYKPQFPDTTQQVFFTTLERQYTNTRAVKLQNYHWLFLTRTSEGWKLVTLYSQLASLHPTDPPLPPLETSNGSIGQGIRLWLRDCQAGALNH
jgi:hypothetical protein